MQDIICKTSYDYDTLLKFNKFVANRKNGSAFIIVIQAIAVILSIFVVVASIIVGFDANMVVIIICVGLIELLFLYRYYLGPIISAKKQSKTGSIITYNFKEDSIEITADTLLSSESLPVEYASIKTVYENGSFLYLFVSMNQAYVVNTDMISEDEAKALKEHLINKIKTR